MNDTGCSECGGSGYVPLEGLDGYDERCDSCNASTATPKSTPQVKDELQKRVAEGLARLNELDGLD